GGGVAAFVHVIGEGDGEALPATVGQDDGEIARRAVFTTDVERGIFGVSGELAEEAVGAADAEAVDGAVEAIEVPGVGEALTGGDGVGAGAEVVTASVQARRVDVERRAGRFRGEYSIAGLHRDLDG